MLLSSCLFYFKFIFLAFAFWLNYTFLTNRFLRQCTDSRVRNNLLKHFVPLLFSPVYTLFFGKKFFANFLLQDPHNLIFDSQLRCRRKSKTHNLRLRVDFNWRAIFSLHGKRFRAISSRRLGREQKGLPAHMCKLYIRK